jgi:hypothetical protein
VGGVACGWFNVVSRVAAPIVVDLGTARPDDIDELREGNGPLQEDVREVMRLVGTRSKAGGDERVFLAIVAVYAEK